MNNTQCPVSTANFTLLLLGSLLKNQNIYHYLIHYMQIRRHLIVQEQTETKHTIKAAAVITTLNLGICRANRPE